MSGAVADGGLNRPEGKKSVRPNVKLLGVRSWAAASPRAVLLHGVSSSSGSWWRIGHSLATAGWSVQAFDLPGHGTRPPGEHRFSPDAIAPAIARSLGPEPIGLLVGHSFGALVALELAAAGALSIQRLVLEEPPGPESFDCDSVADELERNAREARVNPGQKYEEIRAAYPRWDDIDCRQATYDLMAFRETYAGDGIRLGSEWRTVALAAAVSIPTLVLLAPDAPGRYDEREDGTAIRGRERERFLQAFANGRHHVVNAGHCIHRDDPEAWLGYVSDFAARARPVAPVQAAGS